MLYDIHGEVKLLDYVRDFSLLNMFFKASSKIETCSFDEMINLYSLHSLLMLFTFRGEV